MFNVLFWFFGDFRCGALLFMVIHTKGVIIGRDMAQIAFAP